MEKQKDQRQKRSFFKKHPRVDTQVQTLINRIEENLRESLEPMIIHDLNSFQRKQIYEKFEKSLEFKIKTYREQDQSIIKVYPVGKLRRLAEMKAQEVLMKGEEEDLPPMGSYERFVIHDYLKDREGIKTESFGEGKERHIKLLPIFGRTPKKAKRKLTR